MRRHLRHGWIAIAVLAFALGRSAIAAQMEDGQAAFNSGDYAAALRLWRPLAETGNARAQNNLGVMYENGKGVPQNINEAVRWYRLAAEQGYAGAQNNLGLIYAIGRGGLQRDPLRAYMWFSLAASLLSGDIGETVTQSRNVFASAMTRAQIAEATEMARKCQASNYKDCERGDVAASADSPPLPVTTPAVATTSHAVTFADYPRDSVLRHESGAVTVTYLINEQGSVATCTVVQSSGNGRLDEAACVMVKRRWKYRPATEDGKPASIQYISTIEFPRR